MKKIRMYILPNPNIEMGMLPTDEEFTSSDDVNSFIKNNLTEWKKYELESEKYYRYYGENIEVTFLEVY